MALDYTSIDWYVAQKMALSGKGEAGITAATSKLYNYMIGQQPIETSGLSVVEQSALTEIKQRVQDPMYWGKPLTRSQELQAALAAQQRGELAQFGAQMMEQRQPTPPTELTAQQQLEQQPQPFQTDGFSRINPITQEPEYVLPSGLIVPVTPTTTRMVIQGRGDFEIYAAAQRGGQISFQPPTPITPITSIDVARDPTLREATSYFRATVKQDFMGAITGGATMAWRAITKPTQRELRREERVRTQVKELEAPTDIEKPFIPSGRGTLMVEKRLLTQEEIEAGAKTGEYPTEAAFITLASMEEKKIANEFNKDLSTFADEQRGLTQRKYNQIVQDVYSGKLKTEEANTKIEDLNSDNEKAGKDFIREWQRTKGKDLSKGAKDYLSKVQGEIILQRALGNIPLMIIAAAATGGVAALAATGAAASSVVTAASLGAVGYGAIQTERYLIAEISQGTLTKEKVIALGVQFGSFAIGARIGTGLVKGVRVNPQKLNAALKDSKLKSKSTGILKEVDIAKLQIPEGAKAELIARLKAGQSIRKVDVKIIGKNAADQKLINRGLPNAKIKFVEVVDRVGNVIDRVALGKIEIRKGVKTFKQDILARSTGRFTPEGFETETLTLIGREGKPIQRALLTKELSKAQIRVFKKAGVRLMKTDTGVKLLAKRIAIKKRPITKQQLQEMIFEFTGTEGKPLSKAQYIEIQKRTGIRLDLAQKEGAKLAFKQDAKVLRSYESILGKVETSKLIKEFGKLPKIKLQKKISYKKQELFGKLTPKDMIVLEKGLPKLELQKTLYHELAHYKFGKLTPKQLATFNKTFKSYITELQKTPAYKEYRKVAKTPEIAEEEMLADIYSIRKMGLLTETQLKKFGKKYPAISKTYERFYNIRLETPEGLAGDLQVLAVGQEDYLTRGYGISKEVLAPPEIKISKVMRTLPPEPKIEPPKPKPYKPVKMDQVIKLPKQYPTYTGGESIDKGILEMLLRGYSGAPSLDVGIYTGGESIDKGILEMLQMGYRGAPSLDVGIRSALGMGGKALSLDALYISPITVPMFNLKYLTKSVSLQRTKLSMKSQEILKERELESLKIGQSIAQATQQMLRQQQRQMQKPMQKQLLTQQFQGLDLAIPKIITPTIPYLSYYRAEEPIMPKDLEAEFKKQREKASAYTASFSEAVGKKKPLELTKKQLKKLGETEFTGFELRPVIAIKKTKKKKKIKI